MRDEPAALLPGIAGEDIGYVRTRVPDSARGTGWRTFFIVAGSLSGLPVFILGAQVSGALGFHDAIGAVALSAAIMALLGAAGAYVGSRTRMGLAMLSDITFGTLGARFVKLLISVALLGWFGVIVSVLGATASSAVAGMTGLVLPPPVISIPLGLLVAFVAMRGANGLEHIGMVLVPLTILTLLLSVWLSASRLTGIFTRPPGGTLDFGGCVSAIVGSYIVGIVIQPDYGRFVRRPWMAALGSGAALGGIFPVVLLMSSVSSLAFGKPNLLEAMTALGFGLPALVVLLLGAWIDAAACLYSGSLSFANQAPRLSLRQVIVGATLGGILLVLAHAEQKFIGFLTILGIALPPIATVQILATLLRSDSEPEQASVPTARLRPVALLAWISGIAAGTLSERGGITLTGVATVDAVVVSAFIFIALRTTLRLVSRPPALA